MMSAPARLMAVRCSSATASPSIQPLLGSRLDHRVLARHVVRRDRHVDLGAHCSDDVEVGERRLHHHHVGALGDVEAHLLERLAAVAPVLLVALAIAAAGDAARRPRRGTGRTAPRRTWPSRPGSPCSRSPRRRAQSRMARTWPSIIPLGATMSAPASAWAIAASRVQRRASASLSTSPVRGEHAAVAVVGVLVEAQVGDEHDVVAHLVAQVAERELHDAVGVPRLAAGRVLVRRARRRG